MSWSSAIWPWAVYAAVCSFVVFAAAWLAVLVSRQPVKRLRFIQWALVGCLLAPLVNQLPGMPRWHLGVLKSDATADSAEEAASNEAGSSSSAVSQEPAAAPIREPQSSRAEVRRLEQEPAASLRADSPAVRQPAAEIPVAAAPPPADDPPADVSVESKTPARAGGLRGVVLAVYAASIGGFVVWWLAGMLKLIALKRSSHPASAQVVEELRLIADDAPLARRVQVLVSERIDMPLTFGLLRPVILLPASVCEPGRCENRQYCLAHEWSHVVRRDVLPWRLVMLAQFLYFYQPLFWWLRRQMRLCQDFLADDFAARQSAAPEDYAEFLVEQTKKRIPRYSAAALGFADKKSNLFRRVTMLLEGKSLDRRCRTVWTVAVGLVAIGIVSGLASIRLDAQAAPPAGETQEPAKPKADPKPDKPAAAAEAKEQSVTYKGVVVDRITEKPIPNATVIIDRNLSNPPKGMEDFKRSTKTTTDENGGYSFTLAPDEVAQSSLYIVVDCHHRDYVAKGRSGYAHSMIQKNLKLGEPPFYAKIRLWPGKAVTGRVSTPDGKPVEGVEILTYTKHEKAKRFDFGGFYKTKSGKDGRFRFVAATPGQGVYWVTPEGYAPQAHVVSEDRDKMQNVVLQHGVQLQGTVLDAKGKPVAGVTVAARRNGDGEDVDRFLQQNAVANHIGRSTTSNEDGTFELDELPSGTYRLEVKSPKTGWLHEPLKDVFLRSSVVVRDGEDPGKLELRAVPHVEVHVRFIDSKGKPTAGHRFHVVGKVDGDFYFTQSTKPEKKDGRAVVRMPHGLTDARLDLMTNEHGVLRWRMNAGEPLQNGRNVKLGTVEADYHGIEVVRYVAPILLVKAVDENGKQIKEFKPKAVYVKGKSPKDPNSRFINGVNGDVSFNDQPDGRWRSSQLLPDHNVTVVAEKEGFTTDAQVVSLKEGTTKEVVFVLKKKKGEKEPQTKSAKN